MDGEAEAERLPLHPPCLVLNVLSVCGRPRGQEHVACVVVVAAAAGHVLSHVPRARSRHASHVPQPLLNDLCSDMSPGSSVGLKAERTAHTLPACLWICWVSHLFAFAYSGRDLAIL